VSTPTRRSSRALPAWMAPAPRSRRPRRRIVLVLLVAVLAVGALAAVVTDTLGAGYAFGRVVARVELFLNPPPDRETAVTVEATPRPRGSAAAAIGGLAPSANGSPKPTAGVSPADTPTSSAPAASARGASVAAASPSAAITASGAPTADATPTPQPTRGPVALSIVDDPDAVFAHELTKEWCAVAATQIVLAILGKGGTSDAFQRKLADRIGEWESRRDSRDGGWGPGAIALALKAYGVPGYEVRAYRTREDALLDSALAIAETRKPAILLAWYGAHTWVMTGYMADADPLVYDDAQITHAQILDPWYPTVSTIWGASHRPGFFQDMSDLAREYLPWSRPEGQYPDRDGRFIAVVPTTPR
jgi:hypothetical protein